MGERDDVDEGDSGSDTGFYMSYVGFILLDGATLLGFVIVVVVCVVGCVL